MGPKVSVVIPAYNAERYLSIAIESVLRQTHKETEILVVNDGSTDNTQLIIDDYTNQGKICYINLKENRGAANALKVGLEQVSGDYICWLSADDAFKEYKIKEQLVIMEKTNADISYYNEYTMIDERGNILKNQPVHYLPRAPVFDDIINNNSERRLLALMLQNPINGSSVMMKRECIDKYGTFDTELGNYDADCDLWMRYSALGAKFAIINGPGIFYRISENQASAKLEEMKVATEATRLRMIQHLSEEGSLWKILEENADLLLVMFYAGYPQLKQVTSRILCNRIIDYEIGGTLEIYSMMLYRNMILTETEEEMEMEGRIVAEVNRIKNTKEFNSFKERVET
jgi:glycosyltransferase involved in cell wall biosynthesis